MGINLLNQLNGIRTKNKQPTYKEILAGFEALLSQPSEGERILNNLFTSEGNSEKLNFDDLDASRLYHIEDIQKLCIDYRLRFLDSKHFNGTFPNEALDAIKAFEKSQQREITGFKMIAPAGMFKLAEKDKDPLLFVPMGAGYHYLLAQWGNELHPLRKILVYPFRNFESLMKTVFVFCLAIALLFPENLMRGPKDTGTILHIRVIFFFWMVFSTGAMTALYGFSRMKNFNSNLWKSKYLD
ncbi:MAG TPA: hypothetical protein DIT65_02935 [Cryomorphaceae bacterium]|nr:hypothetical protein [Cryomorphaceae bacterium]|tara:strand:+ start:1433 stop:2155 length:723 start_codon:yes stop_codon:yes gene_type:complete